MQFTNKHGLPDPVVHALTYDTYSKGDSDISVTSLIDAPQVRILRREFDDQITEDVTDRLWAVLGTAAHTMFEQSADLIEDTELTKHISEQRVFVEIKGWVVSGAIDLQVIADGITDINDYKVTSVWSAIFGKREWVLQQNCYAGLLSLAEGREIGDLTITAIFRDWKARDVMKMGKDYPRAPIEVIALESWTQAERAEYLEQRVEAHREAEFEFKTGGIDALPECSAEERWAKPDSWAVMRDGRKTAIRVFSNRFDAEKCKLDEQTKTPKRVYVEHRLGESTRCEQDWCRVSQFCPQYARMIAERQMGED